MVKAATGKQAKMGVAEANYKSTESKNWWQQGYPEEQELTDVQGNRKKTKNT